MRKAIRKYCTYMTERKRKEGREAASYRLPQQIYEGNVYGLAN